MRGDDGVNQTKQKNQPACRVKSGRKLTGTSSLATLGHGFEGWALMINHNKEQNPSSPRQTQMKGPHEEGANGQCGCKWKKKPEWID
jgi:hypothetical protein